MPSRSAQLLEEIPVKTAALYSSARSVCLVRPSPDAPRRVQRQRHRRHRHRPPEMRLSALRFRRQRRSSRPSAKSWPVVMLYKAEPTIQQLQTYYNELIAKLPANQGAAISQALEDAKSNVSRGCERPELQAEPAETDGRDQEAVSKHLPLDRTRFRWAFVGMPTELPRLTQSLSGYRRRSPTRIL